MKRGKQATRCCKRSTPEAGPLWLAQFRELAGLLTLRVE